MDHLEDAGFYGLADRSMDLLASFNPKDLSRVATASSVPGIYLRC